MKFHGGEESVLTRFGCEALIMITDANNNMWQRVEHDSDMDKLKQKTFSVVAEMGKKYSLKGSYHLEVIWSENGEYHDSDPDGNAVFSNESELLSIEAY